MTSGRRVATKLMIMIISSVVLYATGHWIGGTVCLFVLLAECHEQGPTS